MIISYFCLFWNCMCVYARVCMSVLKCALCSSVRAYDHMCSICMCMCVRRQKLFSIFHHFPSQSFSLLGFLYLCLSSIGIAGPMPPFPAFNVGPEDLKVDLHNCATSYGLSYLSSPQINSKIPLVTVKLWKSNHKYLVSVTQYEWMKIINQWIFICGLERRRKDLLIIHWVK